MRILPENVMGEERRLTLDEALGIRLDPDHPWFRKYIDFAEALVRAANGRFPVGHSPEVGPTDLHGIFRGHTESILDLADEPEKSALLLCTPRRNFQRIHRRALEAGAAVLRRLL